MQIGELRDVLAIDAALVPVGLIVGLAAAEYPWAPVALIPLLGVLAVFARERRKRVRSLAELSNAYRGTAYVLGDVVEADDAYTGEHCRGVVQLAMEVGERLGLSPEGLRNLEFGALLHDVGKIAIPNEIINKPGKLDPHEWQVIKTHTTEGQAMLDRVGGFMSDVGRIVRSHHERWDGGGYPDGLAGEAIPIEARIVAACDSWNAMTTDRSYRTALPFELAQQELVACAGSQFDPRVVEAMLGIVTPEPARARAARRRCRLTSGRLAADGVQRRAPAHARRFEHLERAQAGRGLLGERERDLHRLGELARGERGLDRGQQGGGVGGPVSSIRSSTSSRRRSPGSRR